MVTNGVKAYRTIQLKRRKRRIRRWLIVFVTFLILGNIAFAWYMSKRTAERKAEYERKGLKIRGLFD